MVSILSDYHKTFVNVLTNITTEKMPKFVQKVGE